MTRSSTLYVISGTKFYRLASRMLFDYWGENLQNKEKSVRKIYWADEGCRLCQRDQSGAEALIVAYLCRHGNFRELFINSIKPHIFVGLHVFKRVWQEKIKHDGLDIHCDIDELCSLPIPELPKNPWWKSLAKLIQSSDDWPPSQRYYYIAKQICHSSNYGVGAGMFCLNTLEKSQGKIVLKKQDAEYFLDMYHGLFPEIREWHQEIQQQVRATRYLYNLLGHPIYFSGDINNEKLVKEFYAAIPQSTVAEITRQAFIRLQEFYEITGCKWDSLQDNHDSILTQCPDSDTEVAECHKIMKQYINLELTNFRGEKFSMKSEGASGKNWAPYHEIKNPEGLKAVDI